MIPLLNTQIVIRYHDIITAYNGANNCSGKLISSIARPTTREVLSSPCATASIASATPRRRGGNADNIGFTHMAEQRRDGCLLR